MKKLKVLMLSLMMVCSMFSINSYAASNEMRAAWVSTVHNIDWPSTKNNQAKQKEEYINLLDQLKRVGMNTVVVQVRPKGDAIYQSNINPWSEYLTGTQGKYPGYDPLPFLIEEAHKRGMEFHAWFNPYRVTTSGYDTSKLAPTNPAVLNPDWVLKTSANLIYNPGLPEVRKHIVDTVAEVVKNYDVDGIHFDDYFYRSGIDDSAAYKKYGNGKNVDDWRRENVNTLLREVKASIKGIKPNVKFGVSPAGIWKNKSSDPTGSDTRGKESYSSDYADSRTWIRQGLVDYITPQVYWTIGYPAADYSKLVKWWANEVKGTNVDLYIGQAIYRPEKEGDIDVAGEIIEQVNLNRQYKEIKGSMHFSARNIVRNTKLQKDLKKLYIENTVTPPPSSNVAIENLQGDLRSDTAAAISKKGWSSGANTVVLVNEESIADGITATPLATTNDSPILLTAKNKMPDATKAELLRLKPSKVILIGGTNVIKESVIKEVKAILPKAVTTRLGGIDRYETSLKIAKEIANLKNISKIYVTGGDGEADALSIASKAGEEKEPIILSAKDNVSNDTYNWLKTKNIQDAYFIGGPAVLSNKVISRIDTITTNNVSNNRIYGEDRQETNAKVIEKFYTSNKYSSVFVTKHDPLVDALTAGPLAAKLKSPIVILGKSVSSYQNTILNSKSTELIYKVGGGINTTSFNKVVNLLK